MAIKASSGKLDIDLPRFARMAEATGFEWLDIKNDHILAVATLPIFEDHRDPFDRLLVAQSRTAMVGRFDCGISGAGWLCINQPSTTTTASGYQTGQCGKHSHYLAQVGQALASRVLFQLLSGLYGMAACREQARNRLEERSGVAVRYVQPSHP